MKTNNNNNNTHISFKTIVCAILVLISLIALTSCEHEVPTYIKGIDTTVPLSIIGSWSIYEDDNPDKEIIYGFSLGSYEGTMKYKGTSKVYYDIDVDLIYVTIPKYNIDKVYKFEGYTYLEREYPSEWKVITYTIMNLSNGNEKIKLYKNK